MEIFIQGIVVAVVIWGVVRLLFSGGDSRNNECDHEARHAVVAASLGIWVDRIRIREQGSYTTMSPGLNPDHMALIWAAGYVGSNFEGQSDGEGGGDYDKVKRYCERIGRSVKDVRDCADAILNQHRNRRAVEALANALRERNDLNGSQIRQIVTQAWQG